MEAIKRNNSRPTDPGLRRARTPSRATVRLLVCMTCVIASPAFFSAPAQAFAGSESGFGGTRFVSASESGGTAPGDGIAGGDASRRRGKRAAAPTIASFSLVANALYDEGRPLKLRYLVKARSRTIHVRAVVRTAAGAFVTTVDLGRHHSGVRQIAALTKDQLGVSAPGDYKLRLSATDRSGRRAARAARVPVWLAFSYSDHRFPLTGSFSWGGADSRFGAGRPGHIHQGQDLAAAEGSPVVAPYGGTISWVRYQADGAGWYVVLDALDGRDYVFMHLQAGSIEVKPGDAVPTGKLLARVGNTGSSNGAHLHFEAWTDGPWQFGGKPIDPRDLLENWYASAPGGAQAASAKATAATASAAASSSPLD
ncbi:MAG: M23 family metallopeptidase [Actinobacteria bacterium]|nr:M23 family metallopeptidase [Actinomycetota bacterium]